MDKVRESVPIHIHTVKYRAHNDLIPIFLNLLPQYSIKERLIKNAKLKELKMTIQFITLLTSNKTIYFSFSHSHTVVFNEEILVTHFIFH